MTERSASDRRDAVTAAVWAVVSAGVLLLLLGPVATSEGIDVGTGLLVGIIVVAVTQCLLLVLRHRRPLLVLAVVSALQAGLLAVIPADTSIQGAGLLVAAYTVGTLWPARRLVSAVVASSALQAVGVAVGAAGLTRSGTAPDSTGEFLREVLAATAGATTVTAAAAAVGAWVALRRASQRSELAAASAQVEYQAALTRSAVAEERTRMARELHDVAAHHLSGIVVQASAAERLVDADPEGAKEVIRGLREQGRATLRDMRSIVGILREGSTIGGAEEGVPVPGLAQLPSLVDSARAAGDAIETRWDGPEVVLAPLADVAVYRTAQEALANARRHAPGATVVLSVNTAAERVVVDVENEMERTSSDVAEDRTTAGHGLMGMRERADLVHGDLQVGPTLTGTWRVVFEVPVLPSTDQDAGGAR